MESGASDGCLQRAGCALGRRPVLHVGARFPVGSNSMNVAEIIGTLLAAWGIGFAMGHVLKFFRRLIEMA